MWQRNHTQDQPADAASNSALQAVQIALDRRDNGGATHPADSE